MNFGEASLTSDCAPWLKRSISSSYSTITMITLTVLEYENIRISKVSVLEYQGIRVSMQKISVY